MATPNNEDFERYNDMMFNYAANNKLEQPQNQEATPPKNDKSRLKLKRKPSATVSKPLEETEHQETTPKKVYNEVEIDLASNENSPSPTQIVSFQNKPSTPVLEINSIQPMQQNKNILQSNIYHAQSVFQVAIFNNCKINFKMPQN